MESPVTWDQAAVSAVLHVASPARAQGGESLLGIYLEGFSYPAAFCSPIFAN